MSAIAGWQDTVLLSQLQRINRRGGLLRGIGGLLTVVGLGLLGAWGASAYPRYARCANVDDPIEYCMSHTYLQDAPDSDDGPGWAEWGLMDDHARCTRTVAGRSGNEFCFGGWVDGSSEARFLRYGAGSAALGLVLLILGLFLRSSVSFIAVLRKRRAEIVWLYGTRLRLGRGGDSSLVIHIGLANGQLLLVHTGNILEPERALAEMANLVPEATVGFTEENRRLFGQDPRAMRPS